jgi:hypothetical protein
VFPLRNVSFFKAASCYDLEPRLSGNPFLFFFKIKDCNKKSEIAQETEISSKRNYLVNVQD